MQLYNTMTRTKEEFVPLVDNTVRMYCCGPTVYNYIHIGNLRAFLFDDIVRRTLEYAGYKVIFVMNITDVGHLVSDSDDGEDKMQKGARREGKTAWDVAKYYTDAFLEDIAELYIKKPTYLPKATDHIKEQIELIQKLEKKGYTYIISDGVYFDTSKLDSYGKLAQLDIKGLQEGARVEFNSEKRNLTDFALWKFSPKDAQRDMEWDSPWGIGFPGWHIECSAMSMKYLGNTDDLSDAQTFDIHCGGIDHIPVHHTNEIAQSEGVTGHPMARFWLHNEFLTIGDGEKMAKSGANFITLDVLKKEGIEPLSYRYFALGAHYRSKLTFTWEALHGAQIALHRLRSRFNELEGQPSQVDQSYIEQFKAFMFDDLNTPRVLALMWDLIKDNEVDDSVKKATLLEIDTVLALDLTKIIDSEPIPDQIYELARNRMMYRNDKKWEEADLVRDEIKSLGYTIEDTDDGFHITKD